MSEPTLTTPRPAAPQRAPAPVELLARRSVRVVVALLAFVAAAASASALPAAPPLGIPDPGVITRWGIPVATVLRDLGASAAIGLVVISLLMRGQLAATTHRALGRAALAGALSSVVAVGALYVLTASDVYSLPIADVVTGGQLIDLHRQTDIGRKLLQQVVLWAVVAGSLALARPLARIVALAGALAALVPWAYGGHGAGAGDHRIAVLSIVLHLVGVTVWVGGVTGLVWVARLEPTSTASVMRRFSPVALAAFVVVATSGLVASWVRLPEVSSLWTSGYGLLILVKTALLVALGAFGVWHRSTLTRRWTTLGRSAVPSLARGVAVEALVMAATIGVAVALSRTPMS